MPKYIGAFSKSVSNVGLSELAIHYLGLRTKAYNRLTEHTISTSEVGLFGFDFLFNPGSFKPLEQEIEDCRCILQERLSAMTVDKIEHVNVYNHNHIRKDRDRYDLWFSVVLSVLSGS